MKWLKIFKREAEPTHKHTQMNTIGNKDKYQSETNIKKPEKTQSNQKHSPFIHVITQRKELKFVPLPVEEVRKQMNIVFVSRVFSVLWASVIVCRHSNKQVFRTVHMNRFTRIVWAREGVSFYLFLFKCG